MRSNYHSVKPLYAVYQMALEDGVWDVLDAEDWIFKKPYIHYYDVNSPQQQLYSCSVTD